MLLPVLKHCTTPELAAGACRLRPPDTRLADKFRRGGTTSLTLLV